MFLSFVGVRSWWTSFCWTSACVWLGQLEHNSNFNLVTFLFSPYSHSVNNRVQASPINTPLLTLIRVAANFCGKMLWRLGNKTPNKMFNMTILIKHYTCRRRRGEYKYNTYASSCVISRGVPLLCLSNGAVSFFACGKHTQRDFNRVTVRKKESGRKRGRVFFSFFGLSLLGKTPLNNVII